MQSYRGTTVQSACASEYGNVMVVAGWDRPCEEEGVRVERGARVDSGRLQLAIRRTLMFAVTAFKM